jgi:hypothetical protein
VVVFTSVIARSTRVDGSRRNGAWPRPDIEHAAPDSLAKEMKGFRLVWLSVGLKANESISDRAAAICVAPLPSIDALNNNIIGGRAGPSDVFGFR